MSRRKALIAQALWQLGGAVKKLAPQEQVLQELEEELLEKCEEQTFRASSPEVVQQAIESIKRFLDTSCIDVNTPYREDSGTLLHFAVRHLNHRVTAFLLRQSADPNALTAGSESPLHWACGFERIAHIEPLLEHGAKLEVRRSYDNSSALHLLVRNFEYMSSGRDRAIRLMLDRGADINARNDVGETPAFFAARCILHEDVVFHTDMVLTLVRHIKKLSAIGLPVAQENLAHLADLTALLPEYDERSWARLDARIAEQLAFMRGTPVTPRCSLLRLAKLEDPVACARIARHSDCTGFFAGEKNGWTAARAHCSDYAYLVERNYQRGKELRYIFDRSVVAFQSITKSALPNMCTEKILAYLPADCMRNVIKASRHR